MAMLKNATTSSGNTGTAGYSFPSRSFTHQKQPNMPSDQKEKLLAMHRDGKANAGMYVAVVLVVYFILVVILLCRYGKRRRTQEPSTGLDSTAEQGRLQLFNSHIGKIISCNGGGDGCLGNLNSACFGKCQRVEASSTKSGVRGTQNGPDADRGSTGKGLSLETDKQFQKKENIEGGTDNGLGKCREESNDFNGKAATHSIQHYDDQQNEDSEESLEDD